MFGFYGDLYYKSLTKAEGMCYLKPSPQSAPGFKEVYSSAIHSLHPIFLSLLVRLPSCLFHEKEEPAKTTLGLLQILTFPTGSLWPAWPWALWPAGTCVPGLVGSLWDFRKLLEVSGSHHTRFTLSPRRCRVCLPHHVSASLNLSCTNQRPSYNTELKVLSSLLPNL